MRPIILVGFVPPALPAIAAFQPEGSVIIVEEPDVVRKRDVRSTVDSSPLVSELIEWEYQLPGAADALQLSVEPAAVVPLVEYATPFAARLAERFGLPGAGLAAAEIMRDKSLLRQVTRTAGIPNPESTPVENVDEVLRFMAAHDGPVILKPANRQGAVGTKILRDVSEVEQAWADCVAQDEGVMVPDRAIPLDMLVEQYVPGHEYSVEMLVRDGIPLFTNITDKALYPGPRPIELGHVVPAATSRGLTALLRSHTTDVLRATGFGTGIVHCEWIVSEGVPFLVECAGRFPGDGIVELIERAYDSPVGQHYFTVMRGEEPPPLPESATRAAAVRFAQVPAGEVLSVTGLEAARAIGGVVRCSLTVGPGDTVSELRSSWDRVGSAMACASTPGEAMVLAEKAMEQVQVVTTGSPQWNSR